MFASSCTTVPRASLPQARFFYCDCCPPAPMYPCTPTSSAALSSWHHMYGHVPPVLSVSALRACRRRCGCQLSSKGVKGHVPSSGHLEMKGQLQPLGGRGLPTFLTNLTFVLPQAQGRPAVLEAGRWQQRRRREGLVISGRRWRSWWAQSVCAADGAGVVLLRRRAGSCAVHKLSTQPACFNMRDKRKQAAWGERQLRHAAAAAAAATWALQHAGCCTPPRRGWLPSAALPHEGPHERLRRI